MPGTGEALGHTHILTQTMQEIIAVFEQMGFVTIETPEIETEFHNFTGLNIPIDHPSRDAFDTFYLDAEDPSAKGRRLLLRSHTSPGQVRIMKQHKPPMAVIVPGRVYRPDAVDASHSFMFHQVEGLLVDEKAQFSELKGLLTEFCRRFFGPKVIMRFRPHFFPFTEPSAEVDINAEILGIQRKKWLEILGCGMVNPKVFEAVGYPKGKYKGFAFGMGVERMAMLKYGINDIRLFYENDVRFLESNFKIMKLSLNWLKDYIDPKLSTDELVERLTMAGLEVEGVEYVGKDIVLELEITPNRPDCLNILGLAREIGAITGKAVKNPKIKNPKTAALKES